AFTARSEAQRVADAAALAGGSAYLDFLAADATQPATDRAYDYALRNTVRNVDVDSSEVQVQVIPDSMKVRVTITRATIPTWFARILGIDDVDVAARAAAQAFQAGEALCLKPFAVPDLWHDVDDDLAPPNRMWDPGEEWEFGSDSGDYYQAWGGPDESPYDTGYGSEWRGPGRDFGRAVQIKLSDPNSEYQLEPSIFLPWRIPEDPNQGTCDRGGGGGNDAGAAAYRRNICACNNSPVEIGQPYPIEPGNMIGPTNQGVDELMAEDPNAYWDPGFGTQGGIRNSDFGPDGSFAGPRVIKVGLFDPTQLTSPGMQDIVFNNFALFFLEGQNSQRDPVRARFLYFAGGSGEGSGGPNLGTLVLYLRLVE
ncbi:MAG: Tad domain-containing protein, partial [Gemmatimonadetes bacterium]|nr:Tad domain-containing protein [Gemmatimonadota bacterium]